MRVLIVEGDVNRGKLWSSFLEKQGAEIILASNQEVAVAKLESIRFDALIINVAVSNTSVFAVSDIAAYRNPEIAIIAVTSGSFFSDGSIFSLIPNARGCVADSVSPKDLSEIVHHYGVKSSLSHVERPN